MINTVIDKATKAKSTLRNTLMPSKVSTHKSSEYPVDYEVLVIGAGIAGIGMACYLQQLDEKAIFATRSVNRSANKKVNKFSQTKAAKRYLVLEKRADLGGTWDLFTYPGIRSDSDALSFGYRFRPWVNHRMLAKGEDIKSYVADTAREFGVIEHIRYHHEVQQLSWSTQHQQWTAKIKNHQTGEILTLSANFVVGATGYYDYDQGYQPHFEAEEDFQGLIVHPQKWHDVDYHNKKVIIIGSGATAMTLLPALIDKDAKQQAQHVLMLQRSPTYVASVPGDDYAFDWLTAKYSPLSQQQAYTLLRTRNILRQQGVYQLAKRLPKTMKTFLTFSAKKELNGSGVDVAHFVPSYNPWDERLCAVPDSDLFKALHSERAEVVTNQIDHFTKTGIQLKSGRHLEADIIITATGLKLQMLGGAKVEVDEQSIDVGASMTYKAVLLENIPNMAVIFGYTNASWTLKVDLAAQYLLRLFAYMKKHNYHSSVPSATTKHKEAHAQEDTIMGSLAAGYIRRAKDELPKQGDRYPWKVTSNYLFDRIMLKHRRIKDEWLCFSR